MSTQTPPNRAEDADLIAYELLDLRARLQDLMLAKLDAAAADRDQIAADIAAVKEQIRILDCRMSRLRGDVPADTDCGQAA